jgi:hypothetical protein
LDDLRKNSTEIEEIVNQHIISVFKKNAVNYINTDLNWISYSNKELDFEDYSDDFKSIKEFHLDLVKDINAGLIFTKIGWGSQLHGISLFPELVKWYLSLEESDLKEKVKSELYYLIEKKIQPIRNKKIEIDDEYIQNLPNSRRVLSEQDSNEIFNSYVGWYQVKF